MTNLKEDGRRNLSYPPANRKRVTLGEGVRGCTTRAEVNNMNLKRIFISVYFLLNGILQLFYADLMATHVWVCY